MIFDGEPNISTHGNHLLFLNVTQTSMCMCLLMYLWTHLLRYMHRYLLTYLEEYTYVIMCLSLMHVHTVFIHTYTPTVRVEKNVLKNGPFQFALHGDSVFPKNGVKTVRSVSFRGPFRSIARSAPFRCTVSSVSTVFHSKASLRPTPTR